MNFDVSTATGLVNLIICGLIGLLGLIGLVEGLIRGMGRTVLRVAFIALAAFASLVTVRFLTDHATALNVPAVNSFIERVFHVTLLKGDALATVESLTGAGYYGVLLGIPLTLVTPLLFIAAFLVFNFVFWILYLVFAFIFFPRGRRAKVRGRRVGGLSRLLGMVIGVAQGALFCAMILLPIIGYAHVLPPVLDAAAEAFPDKEGLVSVSGKVDEYAAAICDHPASSVFYANAGKGMFDYVTSFTYDAEGEQEVVLSRETETYAALLTDISPIIANTDVTSWSEPEADALAAVADDLDASLSLRVLLSGLLSDACTAWSEGKTFFGVAKPTADGAAARVLDSAIDTFSRSTPASVSADIRSIADAVDVMGRYDAFSAFSDTDSTLALLRDPAFLDEMFDTLGESESFREILHETVKAGVQSICSDAYDWGDGKDDAINAIGEGVASAFEGLTGTDEEKTEQVAESFTQTLKDQGVSEEDIPTAVIERLAGMMVEDLANGGSTPTAEDILNYIGIPVPGTEP